MSDSLRDRIAAVLRWHYPATDFHHGVVADAVIAELEHGEKPCGCRPIWKADDE